jgi:hypothetical protein
MELPPLPVDRQYELDLQLKQLLEDHFGPRPRQFGRPLSLYVDTGFREDPERPFIDKTVSFASAWFARLAIEYLSYWCEAGEKYSDSDWLSAIRQKATEAARAIWHDGDRFDRVCLREVSAALEQSIARFVARKRYLEEQRVSAAKHTQWLAEKRAAGRKPVSIETEAMAMLAGVPAKAFAPVIANTPPRKSRGVRIDGPRLMALRLEAGYSSKAAFRRELGNRISRATYDRAESGERIGEAQAHRLLEDLNALLPTSKRLIFKQLIIPD